MFKRKAKSFFILLKNKELQKQIKWKYYLNTNHSPKNTIFISGMARSGTTGLSQILNYNNDYRYIFEPFYPEHVEFCSFFKKRQYLKPSGNYPEFFEAAQRIVSGNFRIQFIDRYNEKFFARKRLIIWLVESKFQRNEITSYYSAPLCYCKFIYETRMEISF